MATQETTLPKVEKLTKWAKEPAVMDLKQDLENSRAAHDAHVARVREWNALREVTGIHRPKAEKNRSTVQPKVVRRQAEWRYSALSEPFLSNPDIFSVRPVTFEDVAAARQNQIVLAWQFRTKIDKVKFIDEYVRTAVDEGSVIVRLGWERLTKKVKELVPVYAYMEAQPPEELAVLQEAVDLKSNNPRGFTELAPEVQAAAEFFLEQGTPVIATEVGQQEVEVEKILQNRPTLQIMDPSNIYIDPSCEGDIDKSKFVIVSFETSKADLLKDGRYKNLDAINWSGNTVLSQPDHATKTPSDFNFNDELRKRVVAYEYWGYYDVGGKEELTPIVATWIGDVMIRMEESPFPDQKPPFVVANYMPVKRSVTGEPDAEILGDNQKIIGALMRGMIDLLGRSANAQQGVAKGFLDATNKRRFEMGRDYEYNPGSGDPRVSVFQHTYPEIPASALNMMAMQNQEAEALTGVKSFAGGMSGEAYGDVAAGIRGMLDAASKREMNILRRLAEGVTKIGKKIIAMNGAFFSDEETIRVTNEKFVKVTREDLQGNFDLIVDISTPEVDESRARELGFMLQTIGPDMDPMLRSIILAEIARLRRMPDLAHRLENYKPEPDPVAEELRQLELEEARKRIQKLDSEIALNMAKARESSSNADKADLDFVEQESGKKHARDLEKQGAQAEANQDLEITKSLLKARKPEESEPNVDAALGYKAITQVTR